MRGIVFLILCFFTVGCAKIKPQEPLLRLNFHSEPTTLDPRLVRDIPTLTTSRMLFEGLFRIHETGIAPALAHALTISKDQLTYQFEIRPACWSDGSPVTAHDFEYAWKSALAPSFPAESAQQLFVVKGARAAKCGRLSIDAVGVKAESPSLLTVVLEHPDNYFLDRLCHPITYPIPRHAAAHDPSWGKMEGKHFVSNGPFLIKRWERGDRLELEKNTLYWDKNSVSLNSILITLVEDEHTELNMYENGELDWAGSPNSSIPPEAIPSLTVERASELHIQPLAGTYCYRFNPNAPPFNNAKIRQAFSSAIERQPLIDNILQAGQLAACHLIPPCLGIHSPNVIAGPNPKTLFEEGLAEMHWTRQTLPPITLTFSRSEKHQKIAQAIQQQWNQAFGIKIGLQSFEWNLFLEKLAQGDYQIGGRGWISELSDPKDFLNNYLISNDLKTNPTCASVMDLLAQVDQLKDEEAREALLGKAEQQLLASCIIAPVYHSTACYLKNPHLKGVYLSPLCDLDFTSAYFDKDDLD